MRRRGRLGRGGAAAVGHQKRSTSRQQVAVGSGLEDGGVLLLLLMMTTGVRRVGSHPLGLARRLGRLAVDRASR